ncbi:MAG: hypothetical protein ACPHRO_09720, partial [Nannocystaceae bacterium]
MRTVHHALYAILAMALGCSGGSERLPDGDATAGTGDRDATARIAETPTPTMEERLNLDARPFPLLTWSAYMIDVDYYDRSRFQLRREVESALRALEEAAPEISAALKSDHVALSVEGREQRVEVGALETTVDASDVVAAVLGFAQEVLRLPDEDLHKLEYAAIDGLLAPLDPHTVLLPPEATADLGVKTRGHFGGIGAEIRAFDRRILIARVLPESPAEAAGVEAQARHERLDDLDGIL